jgi:aminopeptidase YwaD
VASFGFDTESPVFDCIDWSSQGASLTVGDAAFQVSVSPYSLGCRASAPLVVASTIEELEAADVAQKILLLRGDLAREQLMPKNFTFYNPDRHKNIIRLLEAKKPQAIVAATSRDAAIAGAVYPFPLIEDGDFDIPSAHMTDIQGEELARLAGQEARLRIEAQRSSSTGCNVIASKGAAPDRRAVLFAHIDAKDGTAGALDDGTGVVVLLLLAELLEDYGGDLGIEIVAVNGEDYYSAPGEMQYLEINAGRFDQIVLGINLDGAGYQQGNTAYSLYDCPPDITSSIKKAFSAQEGMMEGEPWYQGDHGLFLMNQRPALAITSERFPEILAEIAHTPKDSPDIVDFDKLARTAMALRDLLLDLDTARAWRPRQPG